MSQRNYSETQLQNFAAELAQLLPATGLLCLEGSVGAGKTTFARAFIQARTGIMEVVSPTYTLVQCYEGNGYTVNHFDLYRLKDVQELIELGWEEALSTSFVIAEWPERLKGHTPKTYLQITLAGQGDTRQLTLSGNWPEGINTHD